MGIGFDLKRVMLTVDFDDEPLRHAGEIGEIRSNRMLSTKLDAVDPTITDQVPTDLLGSAAVAPQLAGFRVMLTSHAAPFTTLKHSPCRILSPR